MQKRFCTCGQMIMVRYQYKKGMWRPEVIPGNRVERRTGNFVCPSCGSPVSIHTLQ